MRTPPAPAGYAQLLKAIKDRIGQAQIRAVFSANAELIRLYWDIGRMIDGRQKHEGWGAAVIPRLARELQNQLSEEKGFSERNIKRMLAFYRAYPEPVTIVPQPVAQLAKTRETKVPQPVAQLPEALKLPQPVAKLAKSRDAKVPQPVAQSSVANDSLLWSVPWGHHALLLEKVSDFTVRVWYLQQVLANGWSRNVLLAKVKSEAHRRQGKAITNFERLLPTRQSELVQQALKDPYLFDFLTLEEPFHERELETNLLLQLERFLLELGQGFAFVGRQYPLKVGNKDYYIDLLFYHLKLRCYVVIDLKKEEFKPEYIGKMNFYLSVVDDKLRNDSDKASVGLILCQDRNQIIAEYALRGVSKPIGISEYELTRALPLDLQSALPTVEEIRAELAESASNVSPKPSKHKSKKLSPSAARSKKRRKPQRKV